MFPPICVFITVGPLQSCEKVVSARGPPLSLTLSPSHPPSVSLLRHVQRCVSEHSILVFVSSVYFLKGAEVQPWTPLHSLSIPPSLLPPPHPRVDPLQKTAHAFERRYMDIDVYSVNQCRLHPRIFVLALILSSPASSSADLHRRDRCPHASPVSADEGQHYSTRQYSSMEG